MSKKLKWNPKAAHRARFYMNGIWCALLDHNENVYREVVRDADGVVAKRWYRGGTLKHSGRWYTTKLRVAPTKAWHVEFKQAMLVQARAWSVGEEVVPVGAQPTFVVSASAQGGGVASAAEVVADEVALVLEQLVAQVVAAAPRQSEAHARIAVVAAEATAAARERMVGAEPASQLCDALQQLTEEAARGMKVEQLKEALADRGLEKAGKKAELLARLLAALSEEAEEMQLEEEEEDGAEQQPAAAAAGGIGAAARWADPTTIAEAAGVALQWHLVDCPACSSQLQARLLQPLTQLSCSHCSAKFVAPNAHLVQLPAAPLWKPKPPRKRSQMQRAQDAFVSEEMARVKLSQPDLKPNQRMQVVMQAWPAHKATLSITEPSAAPPPPAAAPLGIVMAQPYSASSGATVSSGVQVLGLQVATPVPLPPPAFFPLAQMPRRKRKEPGCKKHVLKPASRLGKTPTTRPSKSRKASSSNLPSGPIDLSGMDPSPPAASSAPSSFAQPGPLAQRSPNVLAGPSRSRSRAPSAKAVAAQRAAPKRKAISDGDSRKQPRLSTITRRLNDVSCGCAWLINPKYGRHTCDACSNMPLVCIYCRNGCLQVQH